MMFDRSFLRPICRGFSSLTMVLAGVLSFIYLVSCKHDGAPSDTRIKIGLVLDKGGKDDKSFNQAAYRGAKLAEKEFGFKLKDVETADDAAFEPALRTFAERKYPLVIAIGFSQLDAIKKVAPEFPETHFALIDAVADGPNVTSLVFAEQEGSYLVGAIAGLISKTGKIGFIGGMEIPLIKRFNMGYIAGVKEVAPLAVVTTNYVGINSSAWANPSRGKELALGQYGSGVDVIFHAAGASGIGVFDAAEELHKFVIGCDSNQNGIKPGLVATSMLKRVDTAVYDVIKNQIAGHFTAGVHQYGLKDSGIDYAVDENNEKLIADIRPRIEELKKKIIDGTIKVPDYYEISKTPTGAPTPESKPPPKPDLKKAGA
jgi:basic membrane protein A